MAQFAHLSQTQVAAGLAPRELLVLQLLARGYTRSEIASLLAVASIEIEQAERAAGDALGAQSVAEAIRIALRRRLIV